MRYKQISNDTHLGVREIDLVMVNTVARVREGDMGSNRFWRAKCIWLCFLKDD